MLQRVQNVYFFLLCLLLPITVHAVQEPFLAFTDLINGPDTGLNDGKGSGAIVTVWGQNLGDHQVDSKIIFVDSSGKEHTPYVYYWKRADGQLPGGPANLYESHKMQEIAFSIPKSAGGPGHIQVVTRHRGSSNTLPFTVRSGAIYHVKANGNNSTGDGSWDKPWQTVSRDTNGAFKYMAAGDIAYVHDGVFDEDTRNTRRRGIYMSSRQASADAQTGLVVYPNSRATAQAIANGDYAAHVFNFYLSTGVVISKYTALGGNQNEPDPSSTAILPSSNGGGGISATANGRVVGNYIAEVPGKCVSGVAGAIVGGASNGYDQISNFKALGNHIYDWGCDRSSHFGHTTYMTNRSGTGLEVQAWEMAWNYLQDNKSKYGLHNYDQPLGGSCSNVTGTISIHDNYVINQKGAGITFKVDDNEPGRVCWSANFEAYNNILINVGLGPADENGVSSTAINLQDEGLSGTANIHHNTIYNWSDEHRNGGDFAIGFSSANQSKKMLTLNIYNNIIYSDQDVPIHNFTDDIIEKVNAQNNLWHYSGSAPTNMLAPAWDKTPVNGDPKIVFSARHLRLDKTSPALNTGKSHTLERDFYGHVRSASDIGAVELQRQDRPADPVIKNSSSSLDDPAP